MFTKETPIIEVLQANPQSQGIFIRHGMHCSGCLGSEFESVEMGAMSHGIDVQELLQELNEEYIHV
ncbi:MAG: DUF1858 domain-containing protein [Peptococcaceae bacterium]|nr:DUF1858 domain-containing protein [Peptococcaceae bacterium]